MKALTQRQMRRVHSWLGLFFAPMILFFAMTGTIQSLGFQDRRGDYQPPRWIALVANVHKHGEARPGKPHAPSGNGSPPNPIGKAAPGTGQSHLRPFSLFAALLGGLLAATTCLGIAVGLANRRDRALTISLLIAGTVMPLLLLAA